MSNEDKVIEQIKGLTTKQKDELLATILIKSAKQEVLIAEARARIKELIKKTGY